MQKVKNAFKKALKVDYSTYVKELNDITYLGSHYHGYYIPENFLNAASVCYCIGAGEDISFDTELVVHYGSQVFIFDPAPEGKNHYLKLKEAVKQGEKISIGSKPFVYKISKEQLDTIRYIETGVWDKDTMIRFYEPTNDKYVSHSIGLFNHSGKYIEVPVDRLSSLMKKLNHTSVDLLKMEIEGAEYTVIKTIVEDKPDIKMILVEFDELFHAKDFRYLFRIKKTTESLLNAGYTLAHSTPYFKRLFVRNDVFEALKSKGKSRKLVLQ